MHLMDVSRQDALVSIQVFCWREGLLVGSQSLSPKIIT